MVVAEATVEATVEAIAEIVVVPVDVVALLVVVALRLTPT